MENGFEGSLEDWLVSLVGEKGDKGDKGDTGATGAAGSDGKSAYELAVENGYQGSLTEWLASLVGEAGAAGADGTDGKSAYELAVENGFEGSLEDWLVSLVGEKGDKGDKGDTGATGAAGSDGKSAYELAVENGYQGTLTEWLASLVGEAGAAGADGTDGKSAYELAVENGFEGSLEEWLVSLVGEKGDKGDKGDMGETGRGIEEIEIVNGELIIMYTDKTQVNLGSVSETILDRVYTVVFVADGQTVGTVTYTSENTTITQPEVPAKTGYTGRWEEYTLAVGDRTIEAIYTPNSYEVVLSLEGDYGAVSGDAAYRYGEEVVLSAEAYPSYQFLGWYAGEELISDSADYRFLMLAGNVEYVARFSVREDMANFDYVAGKDFCVITGVHDKSVTEMVVPDCVTDIRTMAFMNCRSLTTLTLPFAERNLGYYWHPYDSEQNDTRLPRSLKTIVLSEGLTKISDSAFENCGYLERIYFPSTLTWIGQNAFSGCSSLKEAHVESAEGLCSVYVDRYSSHPLMNLYIDGSPVSVLTIPEGVASIGNIAFYISSVTSVIIPQSVVQINGSAFYSALRRVYYCGTGEEWANVQNSCANVSNATIYYYSETDPGTGNYWHYGTDGVTPVVW